ncbi:hypothetical protein D3C87_342210 [compost metagenome]
MCSASFLTRPCLWLALAAILWASLAPSLAQALSLNPQGDHLQRISVDYCASAGESTLTLDVRQDDRGGGHAGSHEDGHHCPLCRNPQTGVGILPASVPVLPAPAARAIGYPPLFFSAGQPLHAWSAAQPRAPPTV